MKQSRFTRTLAAGLLAVSLFSVTAAAAPGGTAMRVQRNGSASSAVQAVSGTKSPIQVSPEQAEGQIQVTYQDKEGQESQAEITAASPAEPTYVSVNTGMDNLRIRQGPGTQYSILSSVRHGSKFRITGKTQNWYQVAVNGRTGYVSSDWVLVKTQADLDAENKVPPAHGGGSFNSALAQQIVQFALQYKGYPYVYGTAGPNSFDCSGFTSFVYAHFGYKLNRVSRDQLKNGVPVAKAALQPADLLLFSRDGKTVTHVGLYIGNGQFIHASTATTGVIISNLDSNYYIQHYYAARRII